VTGCTGCPRVGDTKKAWFLPVRLRLFRIRLRKAIWHASKGRTSLARAALSPRPSIVCTCQQWGPCKAYYLKGFWQFCESCGTYRPC
jgi:hypothetical protein